LRISAAQFLQRDATWTIEHMVPLTATVIGAISGYIGLVLTTLWTRNLCLPVSAHEEKWQCDAGFVGLATAYFVASFVAALIANRHKIVSGLVALVALFVANGWTPYVSFMFFGERWYQNKWALVFAAAPAVAGVLAGVLVRRRGRALVL
jgi:hypothetical protein